MQCSAFLRGLLLICLLQTSTGLTAEVSAHSPQTQADPVPEIFVTQTARERYLENTHTNTNQRQKRKNNTKPPPTTTAQNPDSIAKEQHITSGFALFAGTYQTHQQTMQKLAKIQGIIGTTHNIRCIHLEQGGFSIRLGNFAQKSEAQLVAATLKDAKIPTLLKKVADTGPPDCSETPTLH